MNLSSQSEDSALKLVDIIDLKWMLAAEGMHVHVERLQSDADYARDCLLAAERSHNPTLRKLAASLQLSLRARAAR